MRNRPINRIWIQLLCSKIPKAAKHNNTFKQKSNSYWYNQLFQKYFFIQKITKSSSVFQIFFKKSADKIAIFRNCQWCYFFLNLPKIDKYMSKFCAQIKLVSYKLCSFWNIISNQLTRTRINTFESVPKQWCDVTFLEFSVLAFTNVG